MAVAFGFLHPELVNRELGSDPAFLKAEAEASSEFLNPWAYEQALLQNPGEAQHRNELLQALSGRAAN